MYISNKIFARSQAINYTGSFTASTPLALGPTVVLIKAVSTPVPTVAPSNAPATPSGTSVGATTGTAVGLFVLLLLLTYYLKLQVLLSSLYVVIVIVKLQKSNRGLVGYWENSN